jgi:hypothetical protein
MLLRTLRLRIRAAFGVRSRFGNSCASSFRKYRSGLTKRPEPSFRDPAVGVSHRVAGQMLSIGSRACVARRVTMPLISMSLEGFHRPGLADGFDTNV